MANRLRHFLRSEPGRLYLLASGFIFLVALSLTLAPAVQTRTWRADYRWSHWPAAIGWLLSTGGVLYFLRKNNSRLDPVLVPLISLLTGWGLLTISRISPRMGYKQTLWLLVASALLAASLPHAEKILSGLRKYKYLWLAGGITLTALTLIFGTNPNGIGPRLWFGFGGVYFQPSEPLKILLILYLAAYFADRQPFSTRLIPLLLPTILITGLACLILVIQRDLGTATILLIIYAGMIYTATGKKRLLLISLLGIGLASLLGYLYFDVVQLRFEAWLNPWLDPFGRSYQIVQSLIAIASGGMTGRGPGLGHPTLVPISFSDFIFSAIAEEFGLPGTIGLILALLVLSFRGMKIGLQAPNRHMRYIAVGISIYLGAQSILIIGGNIRLMPLTGVTLPFLSYGGSSLLTSILALFLLIAIQNSPSQAQRSINPTPVLHLTGILAAGFVSLALINSWWALWRGPDLVTRNDNARRTLSDNTIKRGAILDRNEVQLSYSTGDPGSFSRQYFDPATAHPVGYTHPFYGQNGAELSFDPILRGLESQSPWTVWINHLIYGQPPPGLDVQTSLDSRLQTLAADLIDEVTGAVVLFDARSGEILVLYSSPSYDPGELDVTWEQLLADPESPLLNRATQGLYPPGPALAPFLITETSSYGELTGVEQFYVDLDSARLDCSTPLGDQPTWEEIVRFGCPAPLTILGTQLGESGLSKLFSDLGFYSAPEIRLDTTPPYILDGIPTPGITAYGQADILITPLQMAISAAALTNQGELVPPILVLNIESPEGDWQAPPETGSGSRIFSQSAAEKTTSGLAHLTLPLWEATSYALTDTGEELTWYLAGTFQELISANHAFSVVVLLESKDADLGARIGRRLLMSALEP